MKKTVTWVVKEPKKPARVEKVEFDYKNDDELAEQGLKVAQKLVGGYVECVPLGPGVTILCDEEGGFKPEKEHNCGYVGTLVFVGEEYNDEDESFWGTLTDEQARKVLTWCQRYEGQRYRPSSPQIITGDKNIQKFLTERRDAILSEWDSL